MNVNKRRAVIIHTQNESLLKISSLLDENNFHTMGSKESNEAAMMLNLFKPDVLILDENINLESIELLLGESYNRAYLPFQVIFIGTSKEGVIKSLFPSKVNVHMTNELNDLLQFVNVNQTLVH